MTTARAFFQPPENLTLRKLLLGELQFSHRLAKVQRAFNLITDRGNQEGFQTKVKARAVTRHDLIILAYFFLNHKIEIEIAQCIPFDCDCLDGLWNITALENL